jgi:hypothetical protein
VKPELFTPFFSRIRISQSFVFCVKIIFLSFFRFDILLSVPPITPYSSGFSIFTYLPLRPKIEGPTTRYQKALSGTVTTRPYNAKVNK